MLPDAEGDEPVDLSSTEPMASVTAADRQALATVATYLARSGTTLASGLLAVPPAGHHPVLLTELRDQLLSASLLCGGLGDVDG